MFWFGVSLDSGPVDLRSLVFMSSPQPTRVELGAFEASHMALQVQQLGGEVTLIEAPLDTMIDAFKELISEALRPDDDWLTRQVTQIDVMLGARLLEGCETLAQSGVSYDLTLLAIFSQRCVECVSQESAAYDLTDEGRQVVVRIPEGTTELAPHAFSHCISIQRLTLPSSLTTIGKTVSGLFLTGQP